MKLAVTIFGFCFAAILWQGAAAADAKDPIEIVWGMKARQDRIAILHKGTAEMMRDEMVKTGAQLLEMDTSVWKQSRNVKAAVSYVLSGGNPKVLRKILGLGELSHEDEALARGALAYGEGDDETAQEHLGELDPRGAEPGLAPVLALVQAVLMVKEDRQGAVEKLALARLFGTGTLIEEAALRRQALLVLSMGDPEEFQRLAFQYMRRFPHSIYSDTFRGQFAAQIVRAPSIDDPKKQEKLAEQLVIMKPAERLDLFLSLGSEAIVRGKLGVALFASAQADQLTKEDTPEWTRSRLYQGAALILMPKYETGLAMLEAINPTQLDDQDREILTAALRVARDIRRTESVTYPVSEPPAPPQPGPLKVGQKPPKPPRLFEAPASVTRARNMLSENDKLIERSGR